MAQSVLLFLKGVLVGLANIIPGVSGGTMALVLGIYDRLIRAIGRLGPATVGKFLDALRTPPRGRSLLAFAKEHDVGFLAMLTVGALAAIVATSKIMEILLRDHHDPTYGFFFGLVAASIVVPLALIRRRSWPELLSALVAVVLVVGLAEGVSPEDRLEAAKAKEARAEAAEGSPEEVVLDHSAGHLAIMGLCGAIAISAMILPGVSGSFVLLLFGVYFDMLAAVNHRDFLTLGVFAAGCLVGILFFTRLLAWLFDRFRSQTLAFLVGLMVGSLWSIWPFKSFEIVGGQRIDLANRLPAGLGGNEALTLVATLVGAGLVIGFLMWEKTRGEESTEATAV
jgi:putative membrane protein